MIGGEDHVRIQTFAAGLAPKDAYDRAVALDDVL